MIPRLRRGRQRPETGAVAVEFALVVPLLLMVIFGMVSFGLSYNDDLSISNAAREGTRFGGAVDYSANPSSWSSSVRSRVQQTYFNAGSTLADSQVCVQLIDSSGSVVSGTSLLGSECSSATPPAAPTSMTSGSCAVRVWVVKPSRLSWLLVPDKIVSLSANSLAFYGIKGGVCTAV
jgi:Flp pilus assembly protein TadG